MAGPLPVGLGVWLSAANVAGLLAGPGWHSLVICLAGGGGFLATAAAYRLRAQPQPGPATVGP